MILDPQKIRFEMAEGRGLLEIDGKTVPVDRVTRAFPKTRADGYISFLDELGHEIGLLETLDGMDDDSRSALEAHLHEVYFVPTIEEILEVTTSGTTSSWRVVTDEGERSFDLLGRHALDGEKPPSMRITDSEGRRYQIPDFWALDRDSRQEIQELIPDKILKSRLVARKSSGMVMRMR